MTMGRVRPPREGEMMMARVWLVGLLAVLVVGCSGGGSDDGTDVVLPFTDSAGDDAVPLDIAVEEVTDPVDQVSPEVLAEVTGDPCDPNPCTMPPADSCDADGVTLWLYAATGECQEVAGAADCSYEQTAYNCANDLGACLDGECIEVETDPCDPNPCQNAPVAECSEDGTTLTEYVAPGLCDDLDGVPDCSYDLTTTVCTENDQICANGACVDPCDPNPCTEPPAVVCKGDGTEILLTYASLGLCSYDGDVACEYEAGEYDCADDGMVCVQGACLLEGEGNTPDAVGQIIITEFMAKSQGGSDKGEWLEVYNTTDGPLDLGGCLLRDDGSDSHEIVGPLVIAGGDALVLARSDVPEENHGLDVDYVYSGNSLSNSSDEIIIECGALVIDEITFGGSLVNEGIAAQLDADFYNSLDNDDGGNWCLAGTAYGTAGKLGTPGTMNPVCPEPDPCLPNPCTEPPAALCGEDGLTLTTYPATGDCTADNGVATCDYPATETNCADDELVCIAGACVEPPPDPCDPNPCQEGPADTCNEANTAVVTATVPGNCTPTNGVGVCAYDTTEVACEVGVESCVDGGCVPLGAGDMPTLAGQIIVSEFMARSQSGSDNGEWIEVYNTTDDPLDLNGCLLLDEGSDSKTIESLLVVPAKGYKVLAKSADAAANHGLVPDYVYGGYNLSNDEDEIILKCGDVIVDQVNFTTPQAVLGVAWALSADKLDATANDDMANWCAATAVYGTADKLGTPGLANAVCPEPDPCDPNPCNDVPEDVCDIDGLLLSQYPAQGACTNDNGTAACDYTPVIVNCADTDQVCEAGLCVSACDPNPCNEPPAATCGEDGVTLTTYPALGVCTPLADTFSCDYAPETTDCSETQKVCDAGQCVVANLPGGPTQLGDLVITEFMAKSMGGTDKGEWVEFYNPTETAFNLAGCFLRDDGTDSVEIVDALVVEAKAYVLMARSDVEVENHGLPAADFIYGGGFQLANSSDEIALQCGDVTIDHVAFVTAWVTEAAATQLDPASTDATANDTLGAWCTATTAYGTSTMKGTPGTANVDCVL
jgi:hypothetical protein